MPRRDQGRQLSTLIPSMRGRSPVRLCTYYYYY